ncbi:MULTISPECIES: hypothetical protein [Flavobacterium]|jgi:hypothetical protein|uniref:hypothetical protein n=1 Tax=Flavobacterium TaxID=237 RepID=UPI0022ABCE62|nr:MULTISPECIES: hypothetical protein [Flavobacterium]
MKTEEVPQDKGNLSNKNMKELVYATDEKGNYTTALSTGWEPKTIALSNSIEEISERIAIAKLQVENNEVSPICYYMELCRMDIGVLSSYVGMWQWRVKRHFKPKVFAGLSESVLKKYAETFNITIAELKQIKTS